MKDNYDRQVSMQCPTCGGERFAFQEDSQMIRCERCDLTLTKDELREANGGRIEEEVDALKSEVLKDVQADFAKIFRKWK